MEFYHISDYKRSRFYPATCFHLATANKKAASNDAKTKPIESSMGFAMFIDFS